MVDHNYIIMHGPASNFSAVLFISIYVYKKTAASLFTEYDWRVLLSRSTVSSSHTRGTGDG